MATRRAVKKRKKNENIVSFSAISKKDDEKEIPEHKKKKKTVQFKNPQQLVTTSQSLLQDNYDRTAVPTDVFSCDVCNTEIPCGIRGFEPYATCQICKEGFDVCSVCCRRLDDDDQAFAKCCQRLYNNVFMLDDNDNSNIDSRPTIRLKCHAHELTIIDRQAEVTWANDGIITSAATAAAATAAAATAASCSQTVIQAPTNTKKEEEEEEESSSLNDFSSKKPDYYCYGTSKNKRNLKAISKQSIDHKKKTKHGNEIS